MGALLLALLLATPSLGQGGEPLEALLVLQEDAIEEGRLVAYTGAQWPQKVSSRPSCPNWPAPPGRPGLSSSRESGGAWRKRA